MTLHLTLTWLWVTLGIVWFIGVIAGVLVLQAVYIDDAPRWYVKLLPLAWPLVCPVLFVIMIFRALFIWE